MSDELMDKCRRIHVTFVEASEAACIALGFLLDAIDRGEAGDHEIRQRFGKLVLERFLEAEKAYRDLEPFFAKSDLE